MMYNYLYNPWSFGAGGMFGFMGIFFVALVVWSLYWKGRALWLAARKNNLYWFIALLVINSLGVLEILYIYIFSKKDLSGDSCCGGKKDGECCKDKKSSEDKKDDCGCGHEHK